MNTNTKSYETWREGYGPIKHTEETTQRVTQLVNTLVEQGTVNSPETAWRLFAAADRLSCVAMNVVAHMTYARRFNLSGKALEADDFKTTPEGHTGGSLNMVPAFVGYLLANSLTADTRGWIMGQGHSVAAIEAVNALTGDVSPTQRGRYNCSDEGLSRLCADFYSYAITASGEPGVPLGSHAGPHTAGAVSEGGYLGFAELQYIHMPLPGESLVAFLSDGAYEEQRGSDWAPRWWRADDGGFAIPVMTPNGRRIEQRTEILQQGGAPWLAENLRHNGFAPIIVDGRDPAAIASALIEGEAALKRFSNSSQRRYPAQIPYIIAETEKGFGFPGAGTNVAHNLPLDGNPHSNAATRALFNKSAKNLYVPREELEQAIAALSTHKQQQRPLESQHPMAHRHPETPSLPEPNWLAPGTQTSAMSELDSWFVKFTQVNPKLRFRIGNPDEMASNKMGYTLALLRHRVNEPEPGVPEDSHGAVITALNEEAVAAAALGNKGGLNLIVSYEAFAVKMLGLLRQEIIFARNQRALEQNPGWISVPLIVTSHTWANSKNEQSHQDPTIAEALLAEMSDTSRVLFPVDANSALAALRDVYAGRGQVACVIVSKREMETVFDAQTAQQLVKDGAAHVAGTPEDAEIQLLAIGSYQLEQALRAHKHLHERGKKSCVTAILEPGRLRMPRDPLEADFVDSDTTINALFPPQLPRVLLSHTRPEPIMGLLRRIDNGPRFMRALGFINRGGTFDVPGMLFANRCTWAHAIDTASQLVSNWQREQLLSPEVLKTLDGEGDPAVLR